ncbi:dynein regulatory complex subunit 7 isoform X2 [Channa argus]|uniref:dynein regulatory complex subunit 7 isoform X2 n=1 Tax=Channa argus TaxID=215402 RepID=UPI003520FDE5
METVLESDSEEQHKSEDKREEEDGQLKQSLSNVNVSAADELLWDQDKVENLCPETYRINSPDEIRLMAIADNFQCQYLHLYPERKPLLLCPVNECGVKKFVSMTLRPTPPTYPELLTWEGCASFVAGFLSLDLLESPVELPRYLFSSTSVLLSQKATCFEYATLLCSLLLGTHYDAYCVSGYAVKEMCLLDQSLQECPLQDTNVKSVISKQEQQENKYTVKPPKELESCFLMEQEKKKREAEAALLQKQKQQEESEQRPADPLRGLRVHCWVLVLSGSRSIQENFFIDPLTGNRYSTADDNFLGIESVWNNLNYYVNVQDCSNSCADIVYDLEDLKAWEPVLFGATSKKQLILDVLKKKEMKDRVNIDDKEEEEEPQVFEMPRSWVNYIKITKKDLETRWPGGQKVTCYRKAKLENFAPYLKLDGLVKQLTTYKDLACTEVTMVKEWYQHRQDHLKEREVNKVNAFITEHFTHGQRFCLLFYRYKTLTSDFQYEMEFSSTRVDDLVRRVVSPGEMTEIFEGRSDFLYYRHVVFNRHVQFSESYQDNEDVNKHFIQKVVENFHRNKAKPANQDVAKRVFLLTKRQIEITYHLEDHRFIPSRRSFIKPQDSTEQQKAEDFTSDMVSSFQVDPSEKSLKTMTLYKMLQALVKDEENVIFQIQGSKKEVGEIVACREEEERDVQLLFSPWTTAGAARACEQREKMQRLALEEQRWLEEQEKDILAAFLIRMDNKVTFSTEDAKKLHQDCLAEYKQLLVEQANLIQERYEKAQGNSSSEVLCSRSEAKTRPPIGPPPAQLSLQIGEFHTYLT